MKKLNLKTKIILLFSFIGILLVFSLIHVVLEEQEFIKSESRKKVERISTFRNMNCFYFTDGTSKYFSSYTVIDQKDTLVGIRVISCVGIGDSIVKRKNEAFIRVVRK